MERKTNEKESGVIYQHCMLSDMPPNYLWEKETVKKAFQKSKALFCRFESEWDVSEKTEWWYCVRDTPFDINAVKSSVRYEIKKGRKNFYGKAIDPLLYSEEIYAIDQKKFSEYPEAYRPVLASSHAEHMSRYLDKYKMSGGGVLWFAVFERESDKMAGFMVCVKELECVSLDVMGMDPDLLSKASSAAMVDFALNYIEELFFEEEIYFCDGARSIRHQTNFQAYLVKYFGFRYCYCRLKILYKFPLGVFVKAAERLRADRFFLKRKNGFLYNLGSVIKMERFSRLSKK